MATRPACGYHLAPGDVSPYSDIPATRVLVDATTKATKAEDDVVIVDVIKVDAVVVAAAAEDAVKVVVVVDVAEADEAVANLHKVVRVSEVSLISLCGPGTDHHRRHKCRYRKNQKKAPHRRHLLTLGEEKIPHPLS